VIKIPGISEEACKLLVEYLTFGSIPLEETPLSTDIIVDLLEVSDQFLLEPLKEAIELVLLSSDDLVVDDTWLTIAEKHQAKRLEAKWRPSIFLLFIVSTNDH
jgi:hypothetical protein